MYLACINLIVMKAFSAYKFVKGLIYLALADLQNFFQTAFHIKGNDSHFLGTDNLHIFTTFQLCISLHELFLSITLWHVRWLYESFVKFSVDKMFWHWFGTDKINKINPVNVTKWFKIIMTNIFWLRYTTKVFFTKH